MIARHDSLTVLNLEEWGGDPARLAEVEVAAFVANDHYDDRAWNEDNFAAPLPEKPQLSLVALIAGRPIGFLVASQVHGDPHIHRLAVHPRFAGRGIGSHLLVTFLARLGRTATVACDLRNSAALGIYHAAGFRQFGMNENGKALLRAEALPSIRAWYVFTGTNMHSGHAAHVPRLLETMRRRGLAIEGLRYGTDGDIPTFAPTIGWLRQLREVIRLASDSDIQVIFVRIQWKLALVLSLWSRLRPGQPTVALWSSGGTGVLPDMHLNWRARATRRLHRWALSRAIPTVVTGPPTLSREYASRYQIAQDRLVLACNDIDVTHWQAAASTLDTPGLEPVLSWAQAPGPRYLYVHGLDRIRGADRLPEIFEGLRRLEPHAQLLVIGDGPVDLDFAAQGVQMIGRLSNAELPPIIAQADCLLVPSRQEGFPRVLLESLALGVPPVVFDVGGCRDVLGPDLGSLIAPAGDLQEFVLAAHRAATTTYQDVEARKHLVDRAEAFDTSVVADRLAAVLRVLGSRGPKAAAWVSNALWVDAFLDPNDGDTDDAQSDVPADALRGGAPR